MKNHGRNTKDEVGLSRSEAQCLPVGWHHVKGGRKADYAMFQLSAPFTRDCWSSCPSCKHIEARIQELQARLKNAPQVKRLHCGILRDTTGLSVEVAANYCNLSISAFHRKFRAVSGLTFHRFLIQLRFLRAVEMLRCSDLPITHIAFDSGFGSLSSLEFAFKKLVNCSAAMCRRCLTTSSPNCEKKVVFAEQRTLKPITVVGN